MRLFNYIIYHRWNLGASPCKANRPFSVAMPSSPPPSLSFQFWPPEPPLYRIAILSEDCPCMVCVVGGELASHIPNAVLVYDHWDISWHTWGMCQVLRTYTRVDERNFDVQSWLPLVTFVPLVMPRPASASYKEDYWRRTACLEGCT
jgi:hypothetical protein